MNLKIQANAGAVSRELIRRAGEVQGVTHVAVTAATQSLFVRSKMLLTQLVYQKDIPLVARVRGVNKGKTVLAWRRKMRNGGLLGAERFYVSPDGSEGRIETDPSSDAAKYAFARHNLNRPSPIDGKVRSAPWRQKAKEEGMDYAMRKFRDALREGLGDK